MRQTSSTHGPDGYITIDPAVIADNQERIREKILAAEEELTLYEETVHKDADTLVISYGVTSRAVEDAAAALARKGKPVSTLCLKTLWPVPEKLIKNRCDSYRKVVVVEMNLGQYVEEIRKIVPPSRLRFYGQMNGLLISPRKIMEVIENE